MRRFLHNFENDLAAFLMAVILVVLGLQVLTRYVLGDPLSWTEEVARHLFIWLVFFGASGAIRDRSHVAVDVVANLFPPAARRGLGLFMNILILFFLGNLFYWGSLTVPRMWNVPTATLELPQGLIYLVFPVTAALMILRTVANLADEARGLDAEPDRDTVARSID